MIKDLKEGKGDRGQGRPDTCPVQYVGALFNDGTVFDNSWDRGEPFEFALGQGQVIPGWDQGVEGMKDGGRRLLVIPPDLGYGEAGAGGAIGAERDAGLRRRPREDQLAVGGRFAGGEDRGDQRRQQEAVQGLPVHVVVVDPVQAGAVHEAEPAAHRGAQDR